MYSSIHRFKIMFSPNAQLQAILARSAALINAQPQDFRAPVSVQSAWAIATSTPLIDVESWPDVYPSLNPLIVGDIQ
jgi:hypothetical protein